MTLICCQTSQEQSINVHNDHRHQEQQHQHHRQHRQHRQRSSPEAEAAAAVSAISSTIISGTIVIVPNIISSVNIITTTTGDKTTASDSSTAEQQLECWYSVQVVGFSQAQGRLLWTSRSGLTVAFSSGLLWVCMNSVPFVRDRTRMVAQNLHPRP